MILSAIFQNYKGNYFYLNIAPKSRGLKLLHAINDNWVRFSALEF